MTMQFIASNTIAGTSTTSFTFSNIPQTFTHLQIRANFNANNNASGNSSYIGFNGDGASNYYWHYLLGTGSAAQSGGSASSSIIWSNYPWASGSSSSFMASTIVDILDYTNTNKFKVTRSLNGYDTNTNNIQAAWLFSGLWQSTAAINSITFSIIGSGNYFLAGSRVDLYGIGVSEQTGA